MKRKKNNFDICTFLLIIVLFLILSCSAKYTQVSIFGTRDLNNGGNAVNFRIYLLNSNVKFNEAIIEQLFQSQDSDEQYLGSDLVSGGKTAFVLFPNNKHEMSVKIDEKINYIGVAADFSAYNAESWKNLVPVSAYQGKTLRIIAGNNSITIGTY